MTEKRLEWVYDDIDRIWHPYNSDKEHLGMLIFERVGAHMHWCWYQDNDVRMSPGCLEEVREKQKELFRNSRKKENEIILTQ